MSFFFLLLGISIAGYNLFSSPRLSNPPTSKKQPTISLLIPLRNEENHVPTLLAAIHHSTPKPMEVIYLDDHSEDNTLSLLKKHKLPHHRILRGRPLPPGWLGKNWACHQLAEAATGEKIIFCDADVVPGEGALEKSIQFLSQENVSGISVFPFQITRGVLDRCIVPFIEEFLVFGLLPIQPLNKSRSSKMIAANGQWIGFDRDKYWSWGGHGSVKDQAVEDNALFERAKSQGHLMLTIAGDPALKCEMYSSDRQAWNGFLKNAVLLFGGKAAYLFVMSWLWLGGVLPFFITSPILWAFPFLWRLLPSMLYRHGIIFNTVTTLIFPFSIILFTILTIHSALAKVMGTVKWKGRPT